jgi:bZIP-type transcription factor MBZ1
MVTLQNSQPSTEYITTLEGDVAERDRLLDAIRVELGTSLSENVALRQEIAALKKALLDGRGSADIPILPPPAPFPAQVPVVASTANTPTAGPPATSHLLVPNTQKDLPTSPRLGTRGFWGGAGVGLGGLGGVTPVHTALMPEWSVLGALAKPVLQENINPALNAPGATSPGNGNLPGHAQGFDTFAELHPFTLKALDAYRMQLWGKMAAQHQTQPYQHPALADRMRPLYFAASTRNSSAPPAIGALLSGKAPLSTGLLNPYPSPPASPRLSAKSFSSTTAAPTMPTREQQQHAVVAALASQTLFRKLGGAFWEAFSGSGSGSNANTRAWDPEKVKKVLEGRAVVRVVDVESVGTAPASPRAAAVASLAPAPAVTHVQPPATGLSGMAAAVCQCVKSAHEKKACAVADILEESMRSLTLAKKSGSVSGSL